MSAHSWRSQRGCHKRRQPRLEHIYRHLRRGLGVLMDGAEPASGRWNFNVENRASFGKASADGFAAYEQAHS